MKLAADDVSTFDHAGQYPAVVITKPDPVTIVVGECLERMDEVELGSLGDSVEDRPLPGFALPWEKPAPANMGDAMGLSVGIGWGNRLDGSRDQAEAFVLAELFAF